LGFQHGVGLDAFRKHRQCTVTDHDASEPVRVLAGDLEPSQAPPVLSEHCDVPKPERIDELLEPIGMSNVAVVLDVDGLSELPKPTWSIAMTR
jgi:hypothetical protein